MKSVGIWVGAVVVCVMTIATGVMHGNLSGRWGKAPDLEGAARRLEALPETIGDWEIRKSEKFDENVKSEKFDENVLAQLQCSGYVNRYYAHRKTGDTVSVAILVGPHGPISVHTPEVCYPSMNLEEFQKRENEKIESDGVENDFFNVVFRSRGLEATKLRVWYAWTAGDRWRTPLSPRVAFRGAPMLFKVQVSSQVEGEGSADDDPCREFLTALVPVMRQTVFENSAG